MAAQPSARRSLSVGKETIPGTAVPGTDIIPFSTLTAQPMVDKLPDNAIRSSMAKTYDVIEGATWNNIDLGGPVYSDTIGFLLAALLGDCATVGASAPYTHTISLLNTGTGQGPSLTFVDDYRVAQRAYAGCKLSDLNLKFGGKSLLEYTAKAVGLGYATGGTPASSVGTIRALPGWLGVATIGGTTTGKVLDADVTIKRTVDVVNPVDGTQVSDSIVSAGDLESTGKATLLFEADTLMASYIAGTITSFQFNFARGAGAAAEQVQWTSTNCDITKATAVSGKTWMELQVEWEAIANATDKGASNGLSPIKAVLQNAKASGTYI